MKLKSKIDSINRSFKVSKYGNRIKDKFSLFILGIINQADPHRRIYLHRILQKILDYYAKENLIEIEFVNPVYGSVSRFNLRNCNHADYQSLFECLAYDMYPLPTGNIKFVFDGGGHLGFFSLFSSFINGIEHIVVAEPNPENYFLLEKNIQSIQTPIKFDLHQIALNDKKGTAKFEIYSSNNSHIENTPGPENSTEMLVVNTESILNLIPNEWEMSNTWLKLDIEGAEYKVLAQLLESELRPAAISMEIHDFINSNGQKLVDELDKNGYILDISGYGSSGYVCRQITAVYQN